MCLNHDHSAQTELSETTDAEGRRRFIQGLAAGGALVATGAGVSGCTTNPYTGDKQFTGLVSASQLNQLAAASWAEQKQKIPTTQDPRYLGRLQSVGNRISAKAPKVAPSWDYAVFDQDTKNAFVMPGGRVGFYRGMMDFVDNESQIGAIMGHEVGHVVGRHAQERANQQMGGQLAVGAGTILGGATMNRNCRSVPANQQRACVQKARRNTALLQQALGLGFTFGVVLPYSRKHETQSDLLGVNYMRNAGYDPYQAVSLWEKMAANNPSRQPEFMSTHPDPAKRARTIHAFIKDQEALGSQGFQSIKPVDDEGELKS
jgi:predicted Zn-dependent protease